MELIKKHYEKIVLSLVLLALAVVAVLIFVEVGSFRENLESQLKNRTGVKKKELATVDLSTDEAVLRQLASSVQVSLGGQHPLFGGIRWIRRPSGAVVPDTSAATQGPAGIADLILSPLQLTIDFTRVAGTPDSPRYEFVIGREFEKQKSKRGNVTLSTRVGEALRLPGAKSELFRLLEVKGSATDPSELLIQLPAGDERVIVAPRRAYRKIMGYAAQFTYGPEKRPFRSVRVDDTLSLSGSNYKVVSISDSELVISAPNQLRSSIKPGANP